MESGFNKTASRLSHSFPLDYQQSTTERNATVQSLLEWSLQGAILANRRDVIANIANFGKRRNFLIGFPRSVLKFVLQGVLEGAKEIDGEFIALLKILIDMKLVYRIDCGPYVRTLKRKETYE